MVPTVARSEEALLLLRSESIPLWEERCGSEQQRAGDELHVFA